MSGLVARKDFQKHAQNANLHIGINRNGRGLINE